MHLQWSGLPTSTIWSYLSRISEYGIRREYDCRKIRRGKIRKKDIAFSAFFAFTVHRTLPLWTCWSEQSRDLAYEISRDTVRHNFLIWVPIWASEVKLVLGKRKQHPEASEMKLIGRENSGYSRYSGEKLLTLSDWLLPPPATSPFRRFPCRGPLAFRMFRPQNFWHRQIDRKFLKKVAPSNRSQGVKSDVKFSH